MDIFVHYYLNQRSVTIKEQKKSLRVSMLKKRSDVSSLIKKDYDRWVCSELGKLIAKRNSSIVHTYIPISTEIDINPLLKTLIKSKITVVCPKALPKREFENRVLVSLDDLEVGIMGTKHPAVRDVYEGKYDFIIVPGLAFDSNNYRIGYGGGHYDNFLAQHPESLKVGIFYPFQKINAVPLETHDIRLDKIVMKKFQ